MELLFQVSLSDHVYFIVSDILPLTPLTIQRITLMLIMLIILIVCVCVCLCLCMCMCVCVRDECFMVGCLRERVVCVLGVAQYVD